MSDAPVRYVKRSGNPDHHRAVLPRETFVLEVLANVLAPRLDGRACVEERELEIRRHFVQVLLLALELRGDDP